MLPDATHLLEVARELHKLLWMEPVRLRNYGAYDDGWHCRDHAFILGVALACLGTDLEIQHGRVMFVRGECSGRHPVGLGLESHLPPKHTWIEVRGRGILDLSPNLVGNGRGWPSVPFDGIIESTWYPAGKGAVFICTDATSYEQEIAIGTYEGCAVRAVYWPVSADALTTEIIEDPLAYTFSRIGEKLKTEFDRSIYLKAALHVRDRLQGQGRSLAGVSRSKAWRIIASRPDDVLQEVAAALEALERARTQAESKLQHVTLGAMINPCS